MTDFDEERVSNALIAIAGSFPQANQRAILTALPMLRVEGCGGRDPMEVAYEVIRFEKFPPTAGRIMDYFHGVPVRIQVPKMDIHGSVPLRGGVPAAYEYVREVVPAACGLSGTVSSDERNDAIDDLEQWRRNLGQEALAWRHNPEQLTEG